MILFVEASLNQVLFLVARWGSWSLLNERLGGRRCLRDDQFIELALSEVNDGFNFDWNYL